MGCDIHMRVEYQPSGLTNEGTVLTFENEWLTADYYAKRTQGYEVVPIFDDRNYGLFSILAG